MMEENPKALESVPIFITGWWASLERKKRIKLIAFVILYIFMFVSVCVMVTDDSILVHKMRLRALQAPGLSLQQVRFDLALIKRIGFHSDHNKGFEYQLPKEIRLETSKAYSTNSVETFVRNHINTAINVWQTCVRRSHRARSFRAITHIILIMGLLAIRSAPALFILNRIWMIRAVS
ncbi:unnamed protein product, partial [Dicrocoelium dendriticum]